MFQYLTVPVTAFAQNCSIVWCDETMDAAVIDPGGELERLLAEVKRLGVTLKAIWLTHAHIDHAGGTAELAALGTTALPALLSQSPSTPRECSQMSRSPRSQ
jgi:glyoxylase-like metal-dependent hydrolase (beta-lactamase superfamily II)